MKHLFLSFIALALSTIVFGQAYTVNGDATDLGGDCYILTPAANTQSGSIWYNDQVDLSEPFNIQFTANFDDDDGGADGMVFVFQQVSNTVIGGSGGDIGFGGFEPSLGIEFDIWQNGNRSDPSFDHIGILRDGSVDHGGPSSIAGPVQASPTSGNIEDGVDHIVQITWDPETQLLACYFDCELRIETTIDLVNDVFAGDPIVYWGFTGATGGAVAEQRLCLDPNILGLPEVYTACPGDPVQFELTDENTGTFNWEPAEFLNDPTIPNPIATVTDTTTFVVTYTDLCGEVQIDSTRIDVEYLDINLGQDFNLCPGNSQEITLPEAYEYTWSNDNEGNSIIIDEPGTYYVDATQGNCYGTDTVVVGAAKNVIDVTFKTEDAICGENDGTLTITEVEGTGGPYVFDVGGEPQTDKVFTDLEPGSYTLTATSPDGCIFTQDFIIESVLLVEAGFIADPTEGLAPLTVNLTDTSSNRTDLYYLVNGEIVPSYEYVEFEDHGTYEITQFVWNNFTFCNDTASVTIVIEPVVELDIPNIITPNGDGYNDAFMVKMRNITYIEVEIYNRWGNLIHEHGQNVTDEEYVSLWDPEDDVSLGVYYYIMRATGADEIQFVRQGDLEVQKE